MQRRFRKSRSHQGIRNSRNSENAGFRAIIVASFFTLILNSCTTNPLKKPLSNEQGLTYFCPEQEGKGRITYNKSTQVFSYESYFLEENKKWGLSVYFPLHGEEDLEISLENSSEAKGSFLRSLSGASKKQKKEAIFFLKNLSLVMRSITQPQKFCQINNGAGQCVVDDAVFKFQQTEKVMRLERVIGENGLIMELGNISGSQSKKTTIKYLRTRSETQPIISLELFTSNCL